MNERYLEILVSRAVPIVFGTGFRRIGQQLSLHSGRLDLLLADEFGTKHVVEIKKGAAVRSAVDQVRNYIADFESQAGIRAVGWVVANEIPPHTKDFADAHSVRTRSVSIAECQSIKKTLGLSDVDLLGERIGGGTLFGGGVHAFKKYAVDLETAISELPGPTAKVARGILAKPYYTSASGRMQIVIIYKGFKIGGFNRQQNHFYISTGLVVNEEQVQELTCLNFQLKRKKQSSSTHEHSWWSVPLNAVGAIESAVSFFSSLIDEYLIENSRALG